MRYQPRRIGSIINSTKRSSYNIAFHAKHHRDLGSAAKISRLRLDIRAEAPNPSSSVRVDHVTWRLMKHWHFSDKLNPIPPTTQQPDRSL
jgi:hypothetical protein